MPLTDTAIKGAKPNLKPLKMFDGGGLFLLIAPSGGKWWRLKYRRPDGKENLLSLGTYPDVSLRAARGKRDALRKLLAADIDPSTQRKAEKAALSSENGFEAVALEWQAKFSSKWSPDHAERVRRRLELYLFPYIGSRPIGKITAPEFLGVLRRIEARGTLETAHRAMQNAGQVFRYAVATARAERDPTADLRGALAPVRETHFASITNPAAIGHLMRDLAGYQGAFVTQCALRLAPLVFVRPGELRCAEWSEIDLDAAEWRIPAERMKARVLHIVPLSKQAVEILHELYALTGRGHYVFPGARTNGRPMSENAVLAALRRLGYEKGQMTGHGFRSMASTILNEQGWNPDAIERQLAHGERNKVRGAYNYAEHLPERRKMMQQWADYLDKLKAGADVVSIHAKAA